MKQKYKDILKNKFGWVGAIIGVIFVIYFNSKGNNYACGHCAVGQVCSMVCSPPTFPYIAFIIYPILGFILGLILQWLWRKFK
jgi:hypothetical protein